MMKGSKNSGFSASKSVARAPIGYNGTLIAVPEKTTVDEGSYENKTQVSFADKQTGCYGLATAKETASAGEFQWKNGKSGTRDEYKESSTVRIGNQSGYTEVYNEHRVRNVSFNKNSGSKKLISYKSDDDDDDGDGDKYGGYEHAYGVRCDSDCDSDW